MSFSEHSSLQNKFNFTLIVPNTASIKTCNSLSSHVLNKPKDDFFLAYLVTDLKLVTSEILFVASEFSCLLCFSGAVESFRAFLPSDKAGC